VHWTRIRASGQKGPFASRLRVDGPEAKITAADIRDLAAERLKKIDGLNHLLALADDRLAQLASLDAPPTVVFICLPSAITKGYWSVYQWNHGVETVWNLRAGIKARAMQHGLRTRLLQQETIESDLDAHTSDLDDPADLAWNLFTAMSFKAGGFRGHRSASRRERAMSASRSTGHMARSRRCGRASRRRSPRTATRSCCAATDSNGRASGRTCPLMKHPGSSPTSSPGGVLGARTSRRSAASGNTSLVSRN
jgi:hypothetical protein